MGKCTKCGTQFVGTPENQPADGLCHYCERDALKSRLQDALAQIEQMQNADQDNANEAHMQEARRLDVEKENAELKLQVAKLRDCLEPGKANAINAGLFSTADRLGLPHSSVKHALTRLEDEILRLRQQLAQAQVTLAQQRCAACNGFVISEGWHSPGDWERLEAEAAVMRETLSNLLKDSEAKMTPLGCSICGEKVHDKDCCVPRIEKALSTTAGTELITKMERLTMFAQSVVSMAETPEDWPLSPSQMAHYISTLVQSAREALGEQKL